jgi:16S rRNA processing protein RimM
MRGQTLTIQSAALPVLDEGTFFYFDIINIAVRTTTGDDLGRVAEILTTGASDVYVIRGVAREVLIPAVAEYVLDVDTEQRVMTVSLPDGYLDEM